MFKKYQFLWGILILVFAGFLPSMLSTSFAASHEMPDAPGETLSSITDHSSFSTAKEKTTFEDFLYLNLLERPFTPVEMKYFGFVDISLAELSMDSHWVYVVISVEEILPKDPISNYAVEVDIDLDDRGDFLVWATIPKEKEWSPADKIFIDENDDVGGLTPHIAEVPEENWDGYDAELLDSKAWIRRSPEDDQQVWMAFPIELLEGAEVFIWSVYAQGVTTKRQQGSLFLVSANQQNQPAVVFDQTKFHYNDFVHPKRAGSPMAESRFYPLGVLAVVDNTCRQIFGGTLEAPYPGFCEYSILGVSSSEDTEIIEVVDPPSDDDLPDPDQPTDRSPPDDVIYPPEEDDCVDTVAAPCDDDNQDDSSDDGQYPGRDVTIQIGDDGQSDDGDDDDQSGGGLEPLDWNPSEAIRDKINIIFPDD